MERNPEAEQVEPDGGWFRQRVQRVDEDVEGQRKRLDDELEREVRQGHDLQTPVFPEAEGPVGRPHRPQVLLPEVFETRRLKKQEGKE